MKAELGIISILQEPKFIPHPSAFLLQKRFQSVSFPVKEKGLGSRTLAVSEFYHPISVG